MSENEDDIKQLVNLIIRPDRQRHGVKEDLGFQDEDKGIDLVSTYFEVENPRGYKLECVLLHPKEFDIEKNNSSAIIFSHGNGSNLTESSMISYFLSSEYSKFCVVGFDFSGCGNNDDKYITLGFKEQYDLKAVVDYLRNTFHFKKIGLFGRSMGAATSLLYTSIDQNICGIVCDSPFATLKHLVDRFGEFCVSKDVYEKIYPEVSKIVKEKTGLVIDELNPIDSCRESNVPLFVFHGKNDTLIKIQESEEIMAAYKCPDKTFRSINGNHNSIRPQSIYHEIALFYKRVFGID